MVLQLTSTTTPSIHPVFEYLLAFELQAEQHPADMAFAKSIFALLDTYANCISLLKAFKHRREETSSDGTQHARLRKSLRSDRSLVERAYSSKLSESGSRLKKGDGGPLT